MQFFHVFRTWRAQCVNHPRQLFWHLFVVVRVLPAITATTASLLIKPGSAGIAVTRAYRTERTSCLRAQGTELYHDAFPSFSADLFYFDEPTTVECRTNWYRPQTLRVPYIDGALSDLFYETKARQLPIYSINTTVV